MLPINQYITSRNRKIANRTNIPYLVIHYVGAVSTARNNCEYFYQTYRGASAHYFVDESSIWQCVLDKDISWHCGANSYRHPECRNSNSIGIEMCCFNNNGTLDVSEKVVENTIELAAYICKKYNIPINRVIRHYDVTGKNCPAPMVSNVNRWNDFKNRLSMAINGAPITPTVPDEVDTVNKIKYVTANSGLNIRSGAGTNYPIIGALQKGAEVRVYAESNNWSRIGEGQWVSSNYLGNVPNVATKIKYVTANGGLNIRIGAGIQYRVVGALQKGAKVTVYEESNGWGKVADGQWVSMQYLSDNPAQNVTKTKYVSANGGLNVRSGAGTNYPVVKALTKGTEVRVYSEYNGWSEIGTNQWVSSQYLANNPIGNNYPVKYITANSGLNVRSGAGKGYRIVGALPKGTKVTVYETANGWSRIGNNQWVSSAYLK